MKENLWLLLRSSDFVNVKIGMMIYENNPDLKDEKMEGYIQLVNEYYPEGRNWGELNLLNKKPYAFPKFSEFLPIKIIYCQYNKLTELPYYPALIHLDCAKNKLTELPYYPALNCLSCGFNNLTELPYYPKLTSLYCDTDLKQWYNSQYGTNL